ncbi:MAG: ATP-dependent DNA helicase RecG [Endomicrobia bacterium]|nr:ATP-dependent DNA helicase RecG [Endomicrobiia bacterium]
MKIPIQKLQTVGRKRALYLAQLGINTVEQLLFYAPYKIQDRRTISSLYESLNLFEEKIAIIGKVITSKEIIVKKGLGIFKVLIETLGTSKHLLTLVWYKKLNHRYDVFSTLKKNVQKDLYIIAYGKTNTQQGFTEVNVEDYEIFDEIDKETIHTNRLVPVYRLNEYLSQQWFRELVYKTINSYRIDEYIPTKILKNEKLLDINIAIKNLHFPDTWQLNSEAKKRLIFDKFLQLQLAVLKVKKNIISKKKVGKYKIKKTLLTPFKKKLKEIVPNFDFTKAQKKVINELFNDMLSEKPMNRLLIGDVGSGKTIVAVCCCLLAVENNYQVAFMVPTEILAEQHFFNLLSYVDNLYNDGKKINIALVTGKMSKKHKEDILEKTKNGEIDILIGTHSLIEEKVKFSKLSLIIIDEQHKFGVIQRKKLYEKSDLPDMLIMTATPIPRSLAMTLYGELDISIIDEIPLGRKPVKTFFYNFGSYDYSFVIERLKENEKVYIVYPIIEESKLELRTLLEEYQKLSTTVFKDFKCGLLHGKIKAEEKDFVMKKFRNGEYQALFCTNVIEVGIDVPDATVIVINHAERYGLSQLHQLRGRVGRGEKQSYCILLGELTTEESKKRIEVMLATNDGFKIANEDLRIRGPGSIFGVLQHGKQDFEFSEILEYPELLEKAKFYAQKILFNNEFSFKETELLFKKVYYKYASKFELGSVG